MNSQNKILNCSTTIQTNRLPNPVKIQRSPSPCLFTTPSIEKTFVAITRKSMKSSSHASGEIRNSSRKLVAKLEGITDTPVKRDSMTQLSREAVSQLTRAQHQSPIFNKDLICRWNPSIEWKRLLARTQPLYVPRRCILILANGNPLVYEGLS